jgi:hypothetical protein
MDNIGYSYTNEDIERALNNYPPFGYELKHKAMFSDDDINLIYIELNDYINKYNYSLHN